MENKNGDYNKKFAEKIEKKKKIKLNQKTGRKEIHYTG